MTATIRLAIPKDAKGMSLVLGEIIRAWNSDRPYDPEHVLAHYIAHPDKVACTVALGSSDNVLGFQSLKQARVGNQYGVTSGWGIIGSYVCGPAAGKGIGRLLFQSSLVTATQAGLPAIDATIRVGNESGLAYYDALGFYTYLTPNGCIRKRFDLN